MYNLIVFCVAFCLVGLKGWQHKNVIKNKYGNVFVTSYIMAIMDVLFISLVVKTDNLLIAVYSGAGASIGMILAMYFHNKVYPETSSNLPTNPQ